MARGMDNSLALCHLPTRFTYHEALRFIRELGRAPFPAEIAEGLRATGLAAREAWSAVNEAQGRAETTRGRLLRQGVKVIDYWAEHYPRALRLIEYPPWNLFFIGQLPLPVPTLAIVGTRRPDAYGTGVLEATIPYLKTSPLQIVSGLAHGVDALAHAHACDRALPNFAILGTGLDVLYPADHGDLARRILETGGGLLSEFPPGTPPRPRNFPWRNRIISGLADVTWIVQGTSHSGSLHTAVHAGKQAKLIAATPGSVFSELSDLPNRLLFDGAHPVLRPGDLDLLLSGSTAIVTH